jgi:predicted  nucleic acid-binding Zn-ribbon protein
LEEDQRELNRKREQINDMVVESQANADEIFALQSENETMVEKMEKLSLEVTVVVTEKLTLKKELTRVDGMYTQLKKDYQEQRVNFDLLVDEVTSVNK